MKQRQLCGSIRYLFANLLWYFLLLTIQKNGEQKLHFMTFFNLLDVFVYGVIPVLQCHLALVLQCRTEKSNLNFINASLNGHHCRDEIPRSIFLALVELQHLAFQHDNPHPHIAQWLSWTFTSSCPQLAAILTRRHRLNTFEMFGVGVPASRFEISKKGHQGHGHARLVHCSAWGEWWTCIIEVCALGSAPILFFLPLLQNFCFVINVNPCKLKPIHR